MEKIKLSIIIPTRNRATLLNKTLQAITKVDFPKQHFEVIVIDNGSTDHTKSICESFSSQFPYFQYHYAPEPGLHVGRHIGLLNAKADILVYADDDIEPFPLWLEGIWECFQKDDKIVLVGGKNLPNWELEPPKWILEKWNKPKKEGKWLTYFSVLDFGDEAQLISPNFIWGCNFSIRKSILLEAKGFHPDGVPKELLRYRGDGESHISEYIIKNNLKAYYHPKASVKHFVPASRMTEDYLYHWTFRMAIGESYKNIRRSFHSGENKRRNKSLLRSIFKQFAFLKKKIASLKRSSFEKKLEESYQYGYRFHQNAVKEDPLLYNWVIQEHYMDPKHWEI